VHKRDFRDPLYKEWRRRIRKRDGFTCKMPGCSRGGKNVQIHHIKRWADYPSLRYEDSNGISLCSFCHKIVTNNEVYYEQLFSNIISAIYDNNSRH
jgi:hypothetical protein